MTVSKVLFGVLALFLLLTISLPSGYSKSLANLHFKNATLNTTQISALVENFATPLSISTTGQSPYYVVQFEGTTGANFRKDIEKFAKIVRYVPDNGFIIKLKTSTADLDGLKHLQWYGPYSSLLKIEKNLLGATPTKEFIVNVYLFSNATQSVQAKISALSKKVLDTASIVLKVSVLARQISQIALLPEVEWIEEAQEATFSSINNLLSNEVTEVDAEELPVEVDFSKFDGHASGAKILNAEPLFDLGLDGSSELITITDSGLDKGDFDDMHPDLAGRVESAYPMGRPKTGDWDDPLGHGTHVAGLVAGDGTASDGEVYGLAFGASITMQSVFKWVDIGGVLQKSMSLPPRIDALFEEPYADGSRIHTNSWSYKNSRGEYSIQSSILDRFVWNNPDYVVLFSAGNDGRDMNQDGKIDHRSIATPSTAKNCISVGASENIIAEGGIQRPWGLIGQMGNGRSIYGVSPIAEDTPSDNINGIAAFSSRGPTADGRIKPDIVAPGTNNLSLKSRAEGVNVNESWGAFNSDYMFMGGTSMSTPLVAGAAALVRQYYQEYEEREFISSALVKATLINGAQDMYPGQHGNFVKSRPTFDQGFGRVDVANSLVPEDRQRVSVDEAKGVAEGKRKRYRVIVTDPSETLSVTLAYSDYPASPAVAKALVNDLDLKITDSRGREYFPNGRQSADRKNNVEHIDIKDPEEGSYILEISGFSIPAGVDEQGKQPFALVVSGGLADD